MSPDLFVGVVVWGLFAAAVGRLIAQDTVLSPLRDLVLKGMKRIISNTSVYEYLKEGLTCSSCMAWWAFASAQVASGIPGVTSAPWWVLVFAVWGAAQIVLKARG